MTYATKFSSESSKALSSLQSAQANESLIAAAAPELLAALEAIIAIEDKVDPEGLFRGIESISARSAIAKARGR
jgi:hypothetical protein